ncbi:MAG: hypothetical protein SGJ24_11285 [Chloroflexota bacterium]|nr:hypothetical protein [Chloroflexota bacterium]
MRTRLLLVVTIFVMSIGAVSAVSAQSAGIESVCLITDIGRINDGTFNQFAYEGMLEAAEDNDLEAKFIETTA